MGILVGLPKTGGRERTLQLSFGFEIEQTDTFLPAEWQTQSFIQLTWPHEGTDWNYMLDEVEACYTRIAREIARRQKLLIVSPHPDRVKGSLEKVGIQMKNVHFFQCDTNDTWARDHGFITMNTSQGLQFLDFCFNGWGMKFAANYDNQINGKLFDSGLLHGDYRNCMDFVLEGGSIESDGRGTLLTTSTCLLAPNRNDILDRPGIESRLKRVFNLQRILWLDHGFLAGDDTDSHVDTLARLCPHDTIVYVQCTNTRDEHYAELQLMEQQLKGFTTLDGKPYRLLPLPMPDAIFEKGERLPATYANFLIMNNAVLYPTYNQFIHDAEAKAVLAQAFPGYELVGIDCRALIKQHGSLHCITMQYPAGALQEND